MKGNRGKLAAQAGHAFLHTYWDAERRFTRAAEAYRDSERAYKIGLVASYETIDHLYEKYVDVCGVSKVVDAGLTVFQAATLTCIGIGPIDIDRFEPELARILI